MRPRNLGVILLSCILAAACNVTPQAAVQATPTSLLATATLSPTATFTLVPPTDTPTFTPTATATATATPTATPSATPTATNSPTPLPTDTPTPLPPPTDTPTPQPAPDGAKYPPIPPGQGLIYIINFHSDEAQFHFFDQKEDYYLIPGRNQIPEGGFLELFLGAGHYRWASLIPSANIGGEGEIDITAGQIHGLGLVQGKVGPKNIVEGLWLGSDPLTPPSTPTPTPSPTPLPPLSAGKTILVIGISDRPSEVAIAGQRAIIPAGQTASFELNPGIQDIDLFFEFRSDDDMVKEYHIPETRVVIVEFKHELPAGSICEWLFAPNATGYPAANFACRPRSNQ